MSTKVQQYQTQVARVTIDLPGGRQIIVPGVNVREATITREMEDQVVGYELTLVLFTQQQITMYAQPERQGLGSGQELEDGL